MAQDIRSFTVIIATGTTPAAPQISPLVVPVRQVDRIDVTIPPGPLGQVGFAIGAAGQHVIPADNGQWIIGNAVEKSYPLSGYLTSGQWQLIAYNTGQFPHTLYVTLLMSVVAPAQLAAAPPDLSAISSSGVDTSDLAAVGDLAAEPGADQLAAGGV